MLIKGAIKKIVVKRDDCWFGVPSGLFKPRWEINKFTLISWKKDFLPKENSFAYFPAHLRLLTSLAQPLEKTKFLMKIVSYCHNKAFFFILYFFILNQLFLSSSSLFLYVLPPYCSFFFLFFFRKTLISFTSFFCSLFYYLGNIWLINL